MRNKPLKTPIIAAFLLLSATTAQSAVQWVDQIVAQAGEEVVTQSELQRISQQTSKRIKAQGGNTPSAAAIQNEILEQLILQKIQLQAAKDRGIVIDDPSLERAIENITKENNLSLDDFVKELNSQGITFPEFREEIRQELAITKLKQRELGSRVNVSEQEINDILNRHKQETQKDSAYRLSHILISAPKGADSATVSAARRLAQSVHQQASNGADFASLARQHSSAGNSTKGGDLGWRKTADLPTLFAQPVLNLKKGDVADIISSGNSFHIVKVSDLKSSAQSITETQYRSRHILVQGKANPAQFLKGVRERALRGEDFAALATKFSKDPGSAANGGSLGWAPASTYVPAFAKAISTTPVGAISQPFKSQFGWHILQVQEKRTIDVAEEKLRQRAKNRLSQQKEEAALQEWLQELRDEAYVVTRPSSVVGN